MTANTPPDMQDIPGRLVELEELYNKTPVMMHAIDREGRIRYVSDRWLKRLGYRREDVLLKKSTDFLTPASRHYAITTVLPRFFEEGTCEDVAYEFVAADGAIVDVLLSADSERDGAGNIVLSRAVLIDVSEQRKWEVKAQKEGTFLSSFFDALPDATILTDQNRKITRINAAATKLFGYSEREFLGNTTRLIYPGDVEFKQTNARFNSQAPIEYLPYRSRYRRKDGSLFEAETVGAPIFDTNGDYLGNLGIVKDITAQLEADAEQRALQQQMMHAQKLESLGVLAGGIAHDFNNLLVSILGNADLARQELDSGEQASGLLDGIVNAARKAADLCRQMLAYAGRGRFIVEPIDLSAVVEDMAQILEITVSKNTVLEFQLEPKMPSVCADAAQLRQIVMNLVLNASEALEGKSGFVRIRTGVMLAEQSYLDESLVGNECHAGYHAFLEVSDTGSGMPNEIIEKIFDPFFTTKFTGRGLGLAAVLGIIRGHKGTMRIDTELGSGTSFRVLLPIEKQQVVADSTSSESVPQLATSPKARGLVLVADDEAPVRDVTQLILNRMGFDVVLAEDGRVALDLFRQRPEQFVLVILDLTMPHLDGEGAAREMASIRQDLPLILMSGYSREESVSKLEGQRPVPFIQKPFGIAEMLRAIEEAI